MLPKLSTFQNNMLSSHYIAVVLFVILRISEQAEVQTGIFYISHDARYSVSSSTVWVDSGLECCRACLRVSGCMVVNYRSGTSECELAAYSSGNLTTTTEPGWAMYVYHNTTTTAAVSSPSTAVSTTLTTTTLPTTLTTTLPTTLTTTTLPTTSTTTTTQPFTCEWAPHFTFPAVLVNYFCIASIPAVWDTALDICQGNTGGTLANIDTSEKQSFIGSLILLNGITDKVWVGGRDNGLGDYNWQTSTALVPLDPGYTNWASNEPDNAGGVQYCLAVDSTFPYYQWMDEPCLSVYRFICEKPP